MGTCITITSLTVGSNTGTLGEVYFFSLCWSHNVFNWFTFILRLSFTLLNKWSLELQSCSSVLILWSHYKECTSLVAPVFMQLITWTWHSVFINSCFSASHANAFSFMTSLTLKSITFLFITSCCNVNYCQMSSYSTQSVACRAVINTYWVNW